MENPISLDINVFNERINCGIDVEAEGTDRREHGAIGPMWALAPTSVCISLGSAVRCGHRPLRFCVISVFVVGADDHISPLFGVSIIMVI